MDILTLEQEHLFAQATHVVGIGAAKCGTSWLYNYLNNHPQAVRAKVKEIHYFDAKYLFQHCGVFAENLKFRAKNQDCFDPICMLDWRCFKMKPHT